MNTSDNNELEFGRPDTESHIRGKFMINLGYVMPILKQEENKID